MLVDLQFTVGADQRGKENKKCHLEALCSEAWRSTECQELWHKLA